MSRFLILVILGCYLAAGQTTKVDLQNQTRGVDFSAATSTKPAKTGTSLPGVCSTGEAFVLTTATPGTNFYICTATNTWSSQLGQTGPQGPAGPAGAPAPLDPRVPLDPYRRRPPSTLGMARPTAMSTSTRPTTLPTPSASQPPRVPPNSGSGSRPPTRPPARYCPARRRPTESRHAVGSRRQPAADPVRAMPR